MTTIPLPIIPNIFRCALVWTDPTITTAAVNVMHFEDTSGSTHVASDLAAVLNGAVTAGMWNVMANTTTLQKMDIIKLDGSSATGSFPPSGAHWTGGGAGQGLPQVSTLVKFQTGLRGRKHRGRIYLPHTAENEVNYGVMIPSSLTPCQTAWTNFPSALAAATVPFTLGVASYDRAHAGAGATFTPVQSILVESYTATQRRRQPGRKVSRH